MNRPHALTAAVSVLALVSLSGCASAPSSRNAQSPSQSDAQRAAIATEVRGEVVIGTAFDDGSVPVYPEPVSRYTMAQIRAELEAMYDLDQELVRASYDPDSSNPDTVHAVKAIDRAHSERLKEIVEHIGWPTRELVGLKATQAAYMVIQHAGHDIEFQNRCLSLMVDLVEGGELPASYLALLTDRIRVFQDRSQVFGTQMTMARNNLGVMVPVPTVPIEDPANLDQRRALMGMSPHGDFITAIQIAYETSQGEPDSAFAVVPSDD